VSFSVLADRKKARLAGLLFCFPACNVFMSALYTESLFACLSFAVILISKRSFVLATVLGGAAALVRSTAILLVPFLLSEGLRRGRLAASVASSVVVASTSRVYLHWARGLYCSDASPAEWCADWSDIYSYVQSKFWDVGFLRYYQPKNIGNFLVALPAFYVGVKYCIVPWVAQRLKNRRMTWSSLVAVLKDERLPYVAHLTACLLITLLIANVQIVTRMLSSSPAFLWAQVEVLTGERNWFVKYALTVIHLVYFTIGPVLFSNFLPWT